MRRSFTLGAGCVALMAVASSGTLSGTPSLRIAPLLSEIHLAGTSSTPPTVASCLVSSAGVQSCYQPQQMRAAYNLAPLYKKGITGKGQTIVIVDAYGSPTIVHDLAAFDTAFGLPAPPSFRIIHPAGTIPAYSPNGTDRQGWASETSLDVEWAHAMAPGASILLVETPTDEVEGTSGFPDIVKSENYVIAHHLGSIISQSFAATESTFTKAQLMSLRSAYVAASSHHVTVLAGAGDTGATNYLLDATTYSQTAVINWPSSDPLVTAVGGTTLRLNSLGQRIAPDVAWNDASPAHPMRVSATGGGLSRFFPRPTFQDGVKAVTGTVRGNPDVALSAGCQGVVDVYESFPTGQSGGPWHTLCGTSEATPLFAGILALANQSAGHSLGDINPALYGLLNVANNGLVDVTSGNNTVSFNNHSGQKVTVTGYSALTGYDLVTGVGTINAALFVPALVKYAATH